MSIYFKIKDNDRGPALYVDIDEAKGILENMAEENSNEKYSFEIVEMTKKEFNDLPDFEGF